MRWPRWSSAWRVNPTTLIARIGNTQGIRLRIMPPRMAPISAASSESEGPVGAAAVAWALPRNAASSAGGSAAAAATAGHPPSTFASARQLCAPSARTSAKTSGLWLRCGDKGTWAVQTSPCQACVHCADVSITSDGSGKNSSVLPRAAAGRPATLTLIALPSTLTVLAPVTGLGCAAKLASKAGPLSAVVLVAGIFSVKSPSSGMHSFLQTSQLPLSLTSRSLERTDGL